MKNKKYWRYNYRIHLKCLQIDTRSFDTKSWDLLIGEIEHITWILWVALWEKDVVMLSFFTSLLFLLSHSLILITIFPFTPPTIWIQEKRSTHIAWRFVSIRDPTLSLTNSGPYRIVLGTASLLTSQENSRNSWSCAWSSPSRNVLVEIPPERHAVLNLWIQCRFQMEFESLSIVIK